MSSETPVGYHPDFWKKCTSCRKPIAYKADYWVCNVSTCNRKRVGFQFCTVSCWDAHLPSMNHREAWAEERKAPGQADWLKEMRGENEPKKRAPRAEASPTEEAPKAPAGPPKVLIRRK